MDYGSSGLGEVGGNCLKYLQRGWNRIEGRGNKDFKKGRAKLRQGVGALKSEKAGTPLQTMLFMHLIFCSNVLKKHFFQNRRAI